MANTFSFSAAGNRIKTLATGQIRRSLQPAHIREIRKAKDGTNRVVVDLDYTNDDDYVIDPAVDTITIGTTTYTPGQLTADQLLDAMEASGLFSVANSGSGGSGTFSGTLDAVPDGTTRLAVSPTEKSTWNSKTSTTDVSTIITNTFPSLNGNVNLTGTAWDLSANPTIEKSLTANTALTLSGITNGLSKGVAEITGNGYTLTINGNPVVLKPEGVTSVSVAVLLSGALDINSSANLGISTKTASYTATLADAGALVRMNLASAGTFTVPPNSSVAFPVGTQILVSQTGANQITITAGAGVTINAPGGALKTRVQYSTVSLIKTASTDTWLLTGDSTT